MFHKVLVRTYKIQTVSSAGSESLNFLDVRKWKKQHHRHIFRYTGNRTWRCDSETYHWNIPVLCKSGYRWKYNIIHLLFRYGIIRILSRFIRNIADPDLTNISSTFGDIQRNLLYISVYLNVKKKTVWVGHRDPTQNIWCLWE